MAKATVSDADFLALFRKHGPTKTAARLGVTKRAVLLRRVTLEGKYRCQITPPEHPKNTRHNIEHPYRLTETVKDGIVLVGSDAHFWPGQRTAAFRGFLRFIKDLKPKVVVMNGDVFDGSTISRHPPIGWEDRPTVIQELQACQERLAEVEDAAGKAKLIWTLGNHCQRLETRLATVAPEFARVHGFHLKDHFPAWAPCWSVWVNDDTVIKHRIKGGTHAVFNNTLAAGKTTVTGHLHSLKVSPYSDYNGTRWGVDTGCLADTNGPQFIDYLEDSPVSWRSGFAVLTYRRGELVWPEVAHVRNQTSGVVDFRGELIKV